MTSRAAGPGSGRNPLIILGGTYNALSAARSVGARGVPTYVLSDGRGTPAVRASRFVRGWHAPDGVHDPARAWLRWLADGPRGAVIMPAGDEGLELVADRREELTALGYHPLEANDKIVTGMLDKLEAATLAASVGIPAPRSRLVGNLDEAMAAANGLEFPLAVKPRHSHRFSQAVGGQSAVKAIMVEDRAALAAAFGRLADSGADLTITEFVVGPDHNYHSYYTYLDEHGRPLAHLTKRKLRQYPVGAGLGSYHETVWSPEVAELGLALFQRLDVRGLANVEFKRDARDGQFKLIEANLRLTAADDLVRRAGVDFAWLAYERAVGERGQPAVAMPSAPDFAVGLRQWLPARDLRSLLSNHSRAGAARAWLSALLDRPYTPIFAADDLMPSLAHARHMGRRVVGEVRARGGSDARAVAADPPAVAAAASRAATAPPMTHDGRHAASGDRGTDMGVRRALFSRTMTATMQVGGSEWTKGAMTVARELDEVRRLGPRLYRRQRRDPAAAVLTGRLRSVVYETIWRQGAAELGADVRPWGDGYLDIRLGSRSTRVRQHLVPLGDPIALRIAGDKPAMHAALTAAGVAVPAHVVLRADDVEAAERFVAAHGPCVAKPARNTGAGSGVTSGIMTRADLLAARFGCGRYDAEQMLLEEMVSGTEYRLLVLAGTVIGAVVRRPPSVLGDGRSTIVQLVAAENTRRCELGGWAGIWPLQLDLDAVLTLRAQGLTVRTVLPAGATALIHGGSSEGGNRDADVVDHDDDALAGVRGAAIAAADAIDAEFVSVEIITTDASLPLAQAGGAVLEVNTTPGIAQHHIVSNTDAIVPLASTVLRHVLDPREARRVAGRGQ